MEKFLSDYYVMGMFNVIFFILGYYVAKEIFKK